VHARLRDRFDLRDRVDNASGPCEISASDLRTTAPRAAGGPTIRVEILPKPLLDDSRGSSFDEAVITQPHGGRLGRFRRDDGVPRGRSLGLRRRRRRHGDPRSRTCTLASLLDSSTTPRPAEAGEDGSQQDNTAAAGPRSRRARSRSARRLIADPTSRSRSRIRWRVVRSRARAAIAAGNIHLYALESGPRPPAPATTRPGSHGRSISSSSRHGLLGFQRLQSRRSSRASLARARRSPTIRSPRSCRTLRRRSAVRRAHVVSPHSGLIEGAAVAPGSASQFLLHRALPLLLPSSTLFHDRA